MKIYAHRLTLALATAGLLTSCATKTYVRDSVAPVQDQVDTAAIGAILGHYILGMNMKQPICKITHR